MSDSDLIRRLGALDTATLHESGAKTTLNGSIKMLSGSRRLVGQALTVLCPAGDNLMIHVAVARAQPGDVLIVQCHDPDYGVWGEVLSVGAMSRGVAGLVLDGSVRDLAAIRALDFPLFAGRHLLARNRKVGPRCGERGCQLWWRRDLARRLRGWR